MKWGTKNILIIVIIYIRSQFKKDSNFLVNLISIKENFNANQSQLVWD